MSRYVVVVRTPRTPQTAFAYMADPAKRGMGFTIAILATAGLLILSIVGIVQAWMAISAI